MRDYPGPTDAGYWARKVREYAGVQRRLIAEARRFAVLAIDLRRAGYVSRAAMFKASVAPRLEASREVGRAKRRAARLFAQALSKARNVGEQAA